MSWINGIRGLVSSEELAKDVTGAEALLERHQAKNPSCHSKRNSAGVTAAFWPSNTSCLLCVCRPGTPHRD